MSFRALALCLLAHTALAAEAPLSLTASDGSGLELVRLQARAVVQDPLAFTELRLTFRNPEDRVREGQFRIALPPGAAISRFAMKLEDKWQEGEVVEKEAARRAYEDFLHQRQDPALLEQGAGNEFSARVFPIPARGTKELIVSYSQAFDRSGSHYVLSLKGLPKVGELDVEVSGPGVPTSRVAKASIVPDADIRVPVPAHSGMRAGELSVVRVTPFETAQPEPIQSLLLLVDTSASRALGYTEQLETMSAVVAALARKADGPLTVAAFDQEVEAIYEGTLRGFGAGEVERLRMRRALGASNLEAALKWAAVELQARPRARVLVVGDGVVTAGPTDQRLQGAALALGAVKVERLDALALGGIRDEDALRRLTTAGLPRPGVVLDGQKPAAELAARLNAAVQAPVSLAIPEAEWSWPTQVKGLQAGDQVLVFAVAPGGFQGVTVNGVHRPVSSASLVEVERPLLQRACAQAQIAGLVDRHATAAARLRDSLKRQIVQLSVAQRVLSPFTALLVLETEDDYARYGIRRNALANILVVRDGAVAVRVRRGEALAIGPRMKQRQRKETADAPGEEASALAPRRDDRPEPMMREAASAPAKATESTPGLAAPAEHSFDGLFSATRGRGGEMGGGAPSVGGMAHNAARPSMAMEVPPSPAPASEPVPAAAPSRRRASSAARQVNRMQQMQEERSSEDSAWDRGPSPYSGKFKQVMTALWAGRVDQAFELARAWREEAPGDVLALVALGEVAERQENWSLAARAYGSIIDLFANRADLRRFAAARLERVKGGLELAADSYGKAVEQRPDHPSSHRLYAYALLKLGLHKRAFEAIAAGLKGEYRDGLFEGVQQILSEDAGLVAAAWIRAEPNRKTHILGRLEEIGGTIESEPSLRFVLNWETDANDVDFHIADGAGGHAYFSDRQLPSGGSLYADVTTGYGPECFTIRLPKKERAYPYRLVAHYYARGPMGYGMGKVQLIEHDGAGRLSFRERPYIVMTDRAYVDLGTVTR